jgi:signal recognition particle GTPase
MLRSSEKYNHNTETESKERERQSTIATTKSNLSDLKYEIFNGVEKINQNIINDIKNIVEESDLSSKITYIYTPNLKESIIDYIAS